MLTTYLLCCGLLLPVCILAAFSAQEPTQEARTQDGLALSLRADGTLSGLSLAGQALPLSSEAGGFHVTELLPPDGARRELGIVRGKVTRQRGRLELRASLAEAGLDFQARFQPRAGQVEVEGEVTDHTGKDRALLITFRLPLQTKGWRWWDDIERSRRMIAGRSYDSDGRFGEHGDIPVARLPFSALTSDTSGLSLAVPTHEPRVFRLFCDEQGYQVSFALGLAPGVSKDKARAGFRFLLYRHNPAWGLRSAAQRYYDFFPELYAKRVQKEGSWGFFFHQDKVQNLDDFAAVFCGVGQITLTPEEEAFVRQNSLYTFKHREPWAWWHRVQAEADPNERGPSRLARKGDPPPPPLEEELAIIAKKKQEPPEVLDGNDQIPGPVREVAAAAERCFLYDEHDRPRRLLWHLWRARGGGFAWHSQIPLNPNPRLPSPNRAEMARKYQFQNMATWEDKNVHHVNGVSFDSLTEWTGFPLEDYRRENFRYATIPLTFAHNGRIVQIKGFEDWEMVKSWSEEIRTKGRFLMANTDVQPILFCGRYLDVMGIERSADVVSEEEMALVRTLCYRKPASYYREVTEKGLRKCLFYGIHPGGLQVLGDPQRAETARPLFKKYAPLIQKIAQAGWQPITHAHIRQADGKASGAALKIERFGDKERGLFFTVRNGGSATTTAEIVLDLTALGLQGAPRLGIEEIVEGRAVTQQGMGVTLTATVRIEGGETLTLALKSLSDAPAKGSTAQAERVRFFVDPATNSDDPERRRAYGLSVAPPWKDGGSLFINLPEHLEYMPGTKGIARHHDKRSNVWQVSADGSTAQYDVESITEPGVLFRVKARAEGESATFEMTITNRSSIVLKSIRPLLCFQYHGLKGFPAAGTDNFAHTYVVVGGKPVALERLTVKNRNAYARMAQVKGCPDEHNWWAEQMGGFIEQSLDMAFTALTASDDDRKVAVFWTPGKNLLSNSAIPCIHADPYFGDLAPGESRSARCQLFFTRRQLKALIKECAAKAERPWEKQIQRTKERPAKPTNSGTKRQKGG